MGLLDSIKGIGQGIVKGLGGGIADLATSWIGNQAIGKPNSAYAYSQSQKGAREAFERSYQTYKTRYQDTMADMRKAGLNPILAAGSGGFNVGNSPQMSAYGGYQPQVPNVSSSASARNYADAGLKRGQTKETVRKVQKLRAETLHTLNKLDETLAKTGKIKAETRLIMKNTRTAIMNYWKTYAQFYESISSGELNIQQRKKLNIDIQRLKLAIPELKAASDIYSTPYAGQLIKFMETMIKTLSPVKIKLGD